MSESTQQPPPRQLHGATGNDQTRPAPAPGTLRALLEDDQSGYKRRIEAMLGVKRAPQFISSLITLSNSSAAFSKVKPQSIIAAGAIAATLDLPIDKNLGFAWVIPYGELAQFQIGYKGWVQLALRTGRYAGMNAVIVNEDALGGFDEIGDPIIYWDVLDETKPAIGYAVAWKLTTGFTKIVYWSLEKVKAHAERYSQAYRYGLNNPTRKNAQDSPWFTDFDKMGLKTVVTNGLRRWGIMSVEYQELQFAYDRDQSAAIDIDATPIYPDNERAQDDGGGAAPAEPIRAPEARRIEAPQQPAGMSVEDVKAAGTERKPERARRSRRKAGDEPPAQQQAASPPAQHPADQPPPFMGQAEMTGPASPGSIQTIKLKMERAALGISDLRRVRGFENLQSVDALQAVQVNLVLEWIKDPAGVEKVA